MRASPGPPLTASGVRYPPLAARVPEEKGREGMTGSGSTNWLDDVTFWVNGIASRTHARGGASAGGGGGGAPSGAQGFSLTREEAEHALQEFREIRNELIDLQDSAWSLTQLRPPA